MFANKSSSCNLQHSFKVVWDSPEERERHGRMLGRRSLVAIATRAAHEGLVPIGSLTAPQI